MLNNVNEGDWGVNIKPSARKSIHADCTTCILNNNMGRYGCIDHRRGKRNNASGEQSQGADEVDNVMSKLVNPYSSRQFNTRRNISRRNSLDEPGTNDSDDADEDNLSKSSPATFIFPHSSDDEQYKSATQNEFNTSRDELNSSRSSPTQVRNTRDVQTQISPNRQNTYYIPESAHFVQNTSTSNTSSYETARGGSIFKYLGIFVVVAVAIGINSDYFSDTTKTVNNIFSNEVIFYDNIRNLGAKYRVSSDSILRLESGISTILKNQDAASFILIYDSKVESFNSQVLYSFVEELALKTVKFLRNHSDSIQNVIVDTDKIESESELRALQSEVEKTGVMIVPNINNVPSELAMAFHYYCDEYNPLVKTSAIFFTLDAATCLHSNKAAPISFVEKCLMKKWNDIHQDKIGPLLARVVNVIVPSVLTSVFNDLRNTGNERTENDISDILEAMGYIPQDPDTIKKTGDKTPEVMRNDEAHILSKLSDDELLELLNQHTNKNARFTSDLLSVDEVRNRNENYDDIPRNNAKKTDALFRLENEVLKPHLQNNKEYKAWQKINDLLTDLPKPLKNIEEESLEEEEKEILFDILVRQLKSLCFKKKSKPVKKTLPKQHQHDEPNQQHGEEYMFLILSEDLNENSDELVSWNPEILEKNCSVVVLGPIAKPLPSNQMDNIMKHVTTELSKPEYISLLEQLSKGIVKDKTNNMIVLGAQSRRYMKPHRCNHRSQLARVYGGPKWLLCTGYLNLNTPSLYD